LAPRDDERVSIAEIARRLAGVPLAIELAAARMGTDERSRRRARITRSHRRGALRSISPMSSLRVTPSINQGATRVHRGHLDLAEARAAAADGHARTAEAHVSSARWRIEEARTLARRSDGARMAIKILERAIARA